ncbi:MAG: Hsp20/alpha crystallin family protein [Terrimicrobiaceae bacterium]
MNQLTTCERGGDLRRLEFITPRADLHQNADTYTLELEMPGVAKEGIELTVDNGKLTIVGHRRSEEAPAKAIYSERPTASYRRVFDLDPSIDTAGIKAQIDQGILRVTLGKVEAAKPRKITVD